MPRLATASTAYTADPKENVFQFGSPRPATFAFALPAWLRSPKEVFRVDADGISDVKWSATGEGVVIEDTRSRDAIYVATSVPSVHAGIIGRRTAALAREAANPIDRAAVEALRP